MQSKQIPLFRVDPVAYEIGDEIFPQGNYQEGMGKDQLRIESSLERTNMRTNGIQRKDSVFLFDDIKNALLFWSKKKGPVKPNIYRMSFSPDDFLYKGDMNYLDFILEIVRHTKEEDDKQVLDNYSKMYWDPGFGCVSPCYELMVRKATVEELIMASNSEESQRFSMELNKNSYVQLTDTYKNLVKKYY